MVLMCLYILFVFIGLALSIYHSLWWLVGIFMLLAGDLVIGFIESWIEYDRIVNND